MEYQTMLYLLLTTLTTLGSAASNCGTLSSDCQCGVDCCFKVSENSPPLTDVGRLDHTPITADFMPLQDFLDSNRSLFFEFIQYDTKIICSDILLSSWFTISNSSTGTISTVQQLDSDYYREQCSTEMSCFNVFAQVSYSDGNDGSFSYPVNIDLTDLNDNPPQFTYTLLTNSSVFTKSIKETDELNTQLFCTNQLLATDKDANKSIEYSVSPSPTNFSIIHTEDNKLCVINHIALDRESIDNISFTIVAQNVGASANFSDQLTILLLLEDINDNSPVFMDPMLVLNVSENTTVGSIIATYIATDIDNGSNALITYSLSDNPVPFNINSSTGTLYVNGILDSDTLPTSYSFSIIATDGGGTAIQQSINVVLLDVNDNPPTFSGAINPHYYELSEGVIESSIFNLAIKDSDSTSNLYGFVTLGQEYAQVASFMPIGMGTQVYHSNLFFIVNELDYEAVKEILINFTVSDDGSPELTLSSYVLVNITDINDNVPYLSKTNFSRNETDLSGEILFVLKDYFMDADSCLNGNNKSGDFIEVESNQYVGVNSGDGAVTVKNTMDRESIPNGMITFDVIISDLGTPSLNTTVTIVIVITDANDNEPIFNEENIQFEADEDVPLEYIVGQVKATDSDIGLNGEIQYKLVDSNSPFVINSTTGDISTVGKLDKETVSNYTLTVIAEDRGMPINKSSMINVTVVVNDVNDNDPIFTEKSGTIRFSINSTAVIGTILGHLTAIDIDTGPNAIVLYEIDDSNIFNINNNGSIYTTRTLEKSDAVYDQELEVFAYNTNNRQRNDTTIVLVTVLQINNTGSEAFGALQLYATISAGSVVVLIIAILIVLCCICCLCYHRKHSRSKDLLPLPPQSTIPKKSSLKISAVPSPTTKEEDTSINGDVPRSPIVLFSDEYQVRYFSQDQSMAKAGIVKTETIRVENKLETESPQIPTKQEVEEVSSPPLSEDLSSNSSLSNSLYQSTTNQYYQHSPKNQPMPLREDTLKKHNEAISENYGGHGSMRYPPQGHVNPGHHDIMYPPEVYVTNNGHYPHGIVDDNIRDDEFDGVDVLPPNIQHYLSSNHHSNQSITAPVSHYVSQNGTPPSTDSSPRIHYMNPHTHHSMTPHKSLPAVYYSRHHQQLYTMDQPHQYYEDPPQLQKGLHHYTSSSSSSSTNNHRPELSPPSPPQQPRYPPHAMRHALPRHGRHSHERPIIDGHLSPLDEYIPHIPPSHHSRTHITYPHPVLQPPSHRYNDMSRQSFAASEDNSTVASSILDTYLQFDNHLSKPDYLLSDAISVDER